MNKSTGIIGWIIAALIIIAAVFYFVYNNGSSYSNTTSTSTPASTAITPTPSPTPSPTPTPTPSVPGTPKVVSTSVVATTDTTAVLTGRVNPDGALTAYWYEYGTTANLGSKTSNQSIGSGYSSIPTPGYITGLTQDTTYYFRLVTENQYGKVSGPQYQFATTHGTPPPVGSAPNVKTLSADNISRTGATLNSQVTPDGVPTEYWFEYGTTTALGNTTAFTSVGNGNSVVPVTLTLSDLNPTTTYYFRIDANNQFGTVNGSILNFKTAGPPTATAPAVTTRSVNTIGTSTATFRGSVNPEGIATSYWFEYSISPLSSNASIHSTDHIAIPAGSIGNSLVPVTLNVSGLATSTTYYVRIVAQNSEGTTDGDQVAFVTR